MTIFNGTPSFADWQKHHVIPQGVFGDARFGNLFARLKMLGLGYDEFETNGI